MVNRSERFSEREEYRGAELSTWQSCTQRARELCGNVKSFSECTKAVSAFVQEHKTELFIFGLTVASLAFGPWPTTMLVSKKAILNAALDGFGATCVFQIIFVTFKSEGLVGERASKIQGLWAMIVIARAIVEPADLVYNSLMLFGFTSASFVCRQFNLYTKPSDAAASPTYSASAYSASEVKSAHAVHPGYVELTSVPTETTHAPYSAAAAIPVSVAPSRSAASATVSSLAHSVAL